MLFFLLCVGIPSAAENACPYASDSSGWGSNRMMFYTNVLCIIIIFSDIIFFLIPTTSPPKLILPMHQRNYPLLGQSFDDFLALLLLIVCLH